MLFDSNAKKWIQQYPYDRYEEEKNVVIREFLIKDNISFYRYHSNAKWEDSLLSMHVNQIDLIHCSKTYEMLYSKGFNNRVLNCKELGFGNTWFYLGYPDVAKWAANNYDTLKAELNSMGVKYSPLFPDNLKVLRYMIDVYKTKFIVLECGK